MRAAVAVPVTVKCRLGVDEQEDYESFLAFVDTVAATGCTGFVVHARKAWLSGLSPKENREIPPLRYEWVQRLKRERPQLHVTLNGGLDQVEACLAQLQQVDAVMLGRCAYHEPYRLHLLDCALAGDARRAVACSCCATTLPYVEAQLAQGIALKHISRHVLGLFHAQPGGARFPPGAAASRRRRRGAGLEVLERALAVVEPALA
jgi:tRNA-dihydrouridine synthase A